MDFGGRPGHSVGGAVDAPVKVVISGPDSPVEDWSNDFELGSSSDVNVSILFPSASDRSLFDEVEQDSPILPKFPVKLPSTPVFDSVTPVAPCSPYTTNPDPHIDLDPPFDHSKYLCQIWLDKAQNL
jgi:hypothetical protein